MDVDGIAHDVVAEIVRLAVGEPRLDPSAREPPGEAPAMVVAAHERVVDLALRERRATELAAEHHERVVEQAALLQIHHESRARLIDLPAPYRQHRLDR